MKITVNRKVLLECLKTMIRIVPSNSSVKELNGFFIEANEDDGFLYMTASNQDVAIQRKIKAVLETGGSFIINAPMILDMLTILAGDTVSFEEVQKGIILLKSGKAVYTIKVLDGTRYPKPDIPFPDTVVHISDMQSFYSKTNAVTAKKETADSLKGIHFEISKDKMRAMGCSTTAFAVATKEIPCGGNMDFTLTKENLSYLASAAGDSEMDVGICGNNLIFMKDGMLFSTRKLSHQYISVDSVLNRLKDDYVATVRFEDLQEKMLNTCELATLGSQTSFIKLAFADDKLDISTENDTGSGLNTVPITKVKGDILPAHYYHKKSLSEIFNTVAGTLVIKLDKSGYLIFMDKYSQFVLMPIPDITVLKQAKKFKEIRSNRGKKAKKTKKTNEAEANPDLEGKVAA